MMDKIREKKWRIAKFAAEYKIPTESVIDFLKSKDPGSSLTLMTMMSDDMLEHVIEKFKREIEDAERVHKKIDKIIDIISHDTPPAKPAVKEPEAEPEKPAEPEVEAPPVEIEIPAEEVQPEVAAEIPEPEKPEEPIEEPEVPVVEEPQPAEEAPVEIVSAEPEVSTEPEELVSEIPAADVVETVEAAEKEEVTPAEAPEPEAAVPVETPPVEEAPKSFVKPIFRTETEKELEKMKNSFKVYGKVDIEGSSPKKILKKAKPGSSQQKPEMRLKKSVASDGARKTDGTGKTFIKEIQSETDDNKTKTATTEGGASDDAKGKKKRLKKQFKKEDGTEEDLKSKKKKKTKKFEVDEKQVDEALKRTILSLDESALGSRANVRKKKKKEKAEVQELIDEQKRVEKRKIQVTEYTAVSELANLMNISATEVIQKCFSMGVMVSINQRLDSDTITLVADEFGFEVEQVTDYNPEALEDQDDPDELKTSRPPVVTIMGHVDHGKTSLLDHVRKANVVAGEAGGITQHIGAYRVQVDESRFITFLDTPGHEAFTAMRARGARVTDIVVLIVAADDAVMPQTVEAINHAQAAGVPIVVAINKIDKPNVNIDKIKQQLADRNILVEDWGGKYQCAEISAKSGKNIDVLLEKILLEADLLELKANADRTARGTVVESQLDKGRGITATILVQKGTLKIGDIFVVGNQFGRVRAMFDERNQKVSSAGPSAPVLVLGFEGAPQAGDNLIVVESEREAREISIKRQQFQREQEHRQVHHITLDEIAARIGSGGYKELAVIVKGDVDGSVEALADSLLKISTSEVAVRVIHRGVGAISEGDVLLAAASQAIIIGFQVRPHTSARKLAETEKVEIRLYNVIYDAINEIKSALEGMLSPVVSEEVVGTVEVREVFKVPKVGNIAGCYVTDGKIFRTNKIRLYREGIVVYSGELASLKRFKDDVKEVDAGYECGLNISNFNDIKLGDIIESYKLVETKKKLES